MTWVLRIHLHVFRFLQDRHESQIVALRSVGGGCERWAKVDSREAWDLANHGLAGGFEVGDFFAVDCVAGFELEEDYVLAKVLAFGRLLHDGWECGCTDVVDGHGVGTVGLDCY